MEELSQGRSLRRSRAHSPPVAPRRLRTHPPIAAPQEPFRTTPIERRSAAHGVPTERRVGWGHGSRGLSHRRVGCGEDHGGAGPRAAGPVGGQHALLRQHRGAFGRGHGSAVRRPGRSWRLCAWTAGQRICEVRPTRSVCQCSTPLVPHRKRSQTRLKHDRAQRGFLTAARRSCHWERVRVPAR